MAARPLLLPLARLALAATALTSLVGIDLAAKDPLHKWKEDGARAGTSSVLNIGTLFIPGADAGAVAADGSKLARVATTGVHTADAILPGSGAFMKLGIEKIGFTTNGITDAAKGADGITATTRGAAGLDDMSRLSHPTTADLRQGRRRNNPRRPRRRHNRPANPHLVAHGH